MSELKLSSYPPSFPIPRTTKPHSRRVPASVSITGAPYRSVSCRQANRLGQEVAVRSRSGKPPFEEEEGEHLLPSCDLLGQGFRPAKQGAEHAQVVRPRIGPRQVVGREGVAQLGQVQKIQRRIGRRPGALEQRLPGGIRPPDPLPDLLDKGERPGGGHGADLPPPGARGGRAGG